MTGPRRFSGGMVPPRTRRGAFRLCVLLCLVCQGRGAYMCAQVRRENYSEPSRTAARGGSCAAGSHHGDAVLSAESCSSGCTPHPSRSEGVGGLWIARPPPGFGAGRQARRVHHCRFAGRWTSAAVAEGWAEGRASPGPGAADACGAAGVLGPERAAHDAGPVVRQQVLPPPPQLGRPAAGSKARWWRGRKRAGAWCLRAGVPAAGRKRARRVRLLAGGNVGRGAVGQGSAREIEAPVSGRALVTIGVESGGGLGVGGCRLLWCGIRGLCRLLCFGSRPPAPCRVRDQRARGKWPAAGGGGWRLEPLLRLVRVCISSSPCMCAAPRVCISSSPCILTCPVRARSGAGGRPGCTRALS